MKRITIILLSLIIYNTSLDAQRRGNTFTAMFYNVENLFDTIDHPDFEDEEFTPGAEKHWNSTRYEKKLEDIARVITSIPGKENPAIIGFAEVENSDVLKDLSREKGLKRKKYQVILIEGSDPRGIDCGFMYREDLFTYKAHEMIPVEDLSGDNYPLRGILHISGKGPDGKGLHIYINHWKSRRGGVEETENLRVYSAIALRKELDKLHYADQNAHVIIMGDFNDEPTNRSLLNVLHAGNKQKNIGPDDLYNLQYDKHNLSIEGSYNYRGEWQTYDQIIISYSLINQEDGLSTTYDGGKVFKEEWMMFHDERNNVFVPNRTYGGPNYYGGISDHFPVYVSFSY